MTGQDDLTKRLEACYTGAVHDVMRARGCKDFVLPSEIRPIDPARSVAGPAFTLRGRWAPGTDAQESLLAWTGMLSQAPAGHVVVCQANDSTVAHMGELSAETLLARGVRGYLVDGGCRDVAFIERIGFPVWCRYLTPRDLPDPVEAIKYHMEQKGLAPRDLVPLIGNRNRVYEILGRKRPLTLKMIWRLHEGLGIPAESLIKPDKGRAA